MGARVWAAMFFAILISVWIIAASPTLALAQAGEGTNPTTLHLPVAVGAAGQPTPTQTPSLPTTNAEIFGLLGTLQAAIGQDFSTYLLIADGRRVGLAGQTPEIESRIETLRDQQPGAAVKVWGMFYAQGTLNNEPRVVAADIIPADEAAPGIGLPLAIVQFDLVNLRRGPGNRFERGGQAIGGQACVIINRNQVETWYFIDCPGSVTGWIDRRLVEVRGNTTNVPISSQVVAGPAEPDPTPTAQPPPTATPALPPSAFWRGEFYANTQLADPPAYRLNSEQISFDWGAGSPDPSVPVDGFSARFERTYELGYGYYRFEAKADDGVRVVLDDQVIIDEWHGATDRTYAVGRTLSGRHVLRVEFYEGAGNASLQFRFDYLGSDPVWTASYYGGVELQGVPVFEQREGRGGSPIDYNWGSSSPVPGALSGDFWSARWVGKFFFENGDYIFRANTDDGVRLFLNDTQVFDSWYDGYHEVRKRFVAVGEDEHTIRVEFYDRTGEASLELWWYRERNRQILE